MQQPPTTLEHVPVLPAEIRQYLGQIEGVVVDCTAGLGGHSQILLANNMGLSIIGLDLDDKNLSAARLRLGPLTERARFEQANFADIDAVLERLKVNKVGGILADLGVSSNQLADPERGLSFEVDGPLDMRLDRRQKTTAADLVNSLGEGELADLLYFQSQEPHSRKIAKRICQVRRQGRINSTVMLARLVASAVGEHPHSHPGRIHPATRTFMALRMSVNRELSSLEALLAGAPKRLEPGGRIAIISFHSGEDRIVKEDFKRRSAAGEYRVLTKKPITASDGERQANPRSRSAKLRVAERQGLA